MPKWYHFYALKAMYSQFIIQVRYLAVVIYFRMGMKISGRRWNMIYLTGDTHNDFSKLSNKSLKNTI